MIFLIVARDNQWALIGPFQSDTQAAEYGRKHCWPIWAWMVAEPNLPVHTEWNIAKDYKHYKEESNA